MGGFERDGLIRPRVVIEYALPPMIWFASNPDVGFALRTLLGFLFLDTAFGGGDVEVFDVAVP